MFVHNVYFWLRKDIAAAERAAFEAGVASLGSIGTLRHCWHGRAADTNRPVIDRTYDYALTTVFADKAGHDAYQDDPIHLRFVQDHAAKWIRVAVYDHTTG